MNNLDEYTDKLKNILNNESTIELDDVIKFNDELEIKVKYLNDSIPRLKKIDKGDWIDLCASKDYYILKGKTECIHLGVAMKLPNGYEAYIAPRSSTFKYFGLIIPHSIGIIDNSYSGNSDWWILPVYCLNPKEDNYVDINDNKFIKFAMTNNIAKKIGKYIAGEFYDNRKFTFIPKGARIAQFRIMKNMPELKFTETFMLNNKSRGGFGSTGY